MLKKYSLKKLLLFSLTITLLLILINATISVFYYNKIQKREQYIVELYKLSYKIIFFKTTQEKYLHQNLTSENIELEKFLVETKQINTQINTIANKRLTRKFKFQSEVNKISNDFDDNLKFFSKFISIEDALYNNEKGLILDNQRLKKKIQTDPDYIKLSFTNDFNYLIKSEAQLMTREIELEDFINEYGIIKEKIALLDITDLYLNYAKSKFIDETTEYKDIVVNIYMKKTELGFSQEEGLLSDINQKNIILLDRINKIIISSHDRQNSLAKLNIINFLLILFVFSFIILLTLFFIFHKIHTPLLDLKKQFNNILSDEAIIKNNLDLNKDFQEINNSYTELKSEINRKNTYINQILNKDFDFTFQEFTENDILNNSIKKLKVNLQKDAIKSQELRETENQQKWLTTGLATISDIMRQNTEHLTELTEKVLKNIIEYLDIAQGAFYIFIDKPKEKYLQLSVSYAYGKEKTKKKKIQLYQGLLGTVAVEKKYLYFEKIPDDYIYLSTGYGYSKPRSLIIFPLVVEGKLYGVIELASIDLFPQYKIDFLLKLSYDIALTISYVEINEQTSKLLEQTKLQADEHEQTEEKLRKEQQEMEANLELLTMKLKEAKLENREKEEIIKQKIKEIKSNKNRYENKITVLQKKIKK